MDSATFAELVNNAALLLALGVVYDVLAYKRTNGQALLQQLVSGTILAVMGVAVMLNPWDFGGGIVFDSRSILLSLSGLFFGAVPTLIAVVGTVAFRLYEGGAGMWTGSAVILSSAGIGLAWRYWHPKKRSANASIWEMYVLGLVVHGVMLLLMLTLPDQAGMNVLATITLPVLTIYPVVTLMLGALLINRQARQRIAEDLRQSEARFRAILNTIPDLAWLKDRQGRLVAVNQSLARALDAASPEECTGTTDFDHFDPKNARSYVADDQKVMASGSERCVEEIIVTNQGPRWVETIKNPWRDASGQVVGTVGIARDITARRETEEILREREETYRALVEGVPDTIMRFDHEARHLFVSPNVAQTVDIPPSQFIGKTHRELGFPEALCQSWEDAIRQVFDSGAAYETEFSFPGKQGLTIFDWRLVPEFDAHGQVRSVLSISRDVTVYRQAEENYQTLFREMLDGFALHEIICDADGRPIDYRFLAVNPAFERLTGLRAQDIVGKTVLEVLPATEPYWIETYGHVALTGEPAFFASFSEALGKHYQVSAFCPAPNQFACIFTDITERVHAEEERIKLAEQLQQARRLESVGLLAGGVAHDLNNMLTPILGYSGLLHDDLPPDDPRRADVEQIIAAATRARTLVRQLLAFARKQTLEIKPLNLNQLVRDFHKMLEHTLREDITLEIRLQDDLGTVAADAGQIEQIIMNLAVNAQDAMPYGGTLLIETAETTLDENYVATHPEIRPGPYVMLAISDTGTGMDKETLARVFEPFFTTKEVGKGTGLGLATVYGIVKQHGGSIAVYSEIGRGSTFKVYLPRTDARPEELAAAANPQSVRGTETILVAEDNEQVRALACKLLQRSGYTVLEACDGHAAFEAAAAHPGDIHLLLTDLVMPDINGKALYEQLALTWPKLRVLYMSGYTANVIAQNGEIGAGVTLVQKPFQAHDLLPKVRQVLDKN